MGRGSSGRTSTSQQRTSTPRPQQPQQQERQRRTPEDYYNIFQNANDTQATQVLNEWRQERMDTDNRSNDNDIQRFFHNVGWSEHTPEVLDEQEYQQAWRAAGRPEQLYHSDYGAGNATSQDFARQFFGQGRDANGNTYRHFVSNGIYGGGTYFANSASDSASYGDNQFRGFLNRNARSISFNQLRRNYNAYVRAHPAFGRMMNRVTAGYGGSDEKLSIFAAMRGYNVITNGYGYTVVLDRRAVTVSTQQRQTTSRMRNW